MSHIRLCLKETPASYTSASIRTSTDAALIAHRIIGNECQENMLAIYTDVRLNILHSHIIATGGFTSVECDPKVLFSAALLAGAVNIVLAHNHPSGDPSPSMHDDRLTERFAQGAKLLGMKIIDHVIVTQRPNTFYSYEMEGRLSESGAVGARTRMPNRPPLSSPIPGAF